MFVEASIDEATHFAVGFKRHDLDVAKIDLINNGLCLYSPIKYYREGRLDIINIMEVRAKIEFVPYGTDENQSIYLEFIREIDKN